MRGNALPYQAPAPSMDGHVHKQTHKHTPLEDVLDPHLIVYGRWLIPQVIQRSWAQRLLYEQWGGGGEVLRLITNDYGREGERDLLIFLIT